MWLIIAVSVFGICVVVLLRIEINNLRIEMRKWLPGLSKLGVLQTHGPIDAMKSTLNNMVDLVDFMSQDCDADAMHDEVENIDDVKHAAAHMKELGRRLELTVVKRKLGG